MSAARRAGWSAEEIRLEEPGRVRASVVRASRAVRAIVRLAHRPTIEGLERLPRGPFLLVANHSGGLGIAEILSFAALYLEAFGDTRPLAGFAHPMSFRLWPTSSLLPAMGAIPSTYTHARQTLAQGVPLLVFPGGDHETLRPVWQHARVDFGGRTGFLRIAREAGVPIVPMGIRGGALTAPMLVRSRRLARLLVLPHLIGQKRWGVSLLGVLGVAGIAALPLPLTAKVLASAVWVGSPLSLLAWIPWTLRFRVGEPIAPEALFSSSDGRSDDDVLRGALAKVEGAVQALVSAA
jgi:1-acyl-sn-glycerol-3-phosphate acyltransferase